MSKYDNDLKESLDTSFANAPNDMLTLTKGDISLVAYDSGAELRVRNGVTNGNAIKHESLNSAYSAWYLL